MKDIQKLLVVVNPDVEEDYVITRALLLARVFRPEIELFINKPNVIDPESYPSRHFTDRFFRTQKKLFARHYRQRLTAIRERFEAIDITVHTHFSEEKRGAEAVLNRIRDYRPDLTLKSVQRQSVLSRILITSTDWRLIKHSPCPLWLVKSMEWLEDGSLMAAVDPLHAKAQQNELDHLLLDTTAALASRLELATRVFHNYFPDISAMFPKVLDAEDYILEVRNHHQEKMQALVREHQLDMDNVVMARGDLARTLEQSIRKERVNLLVLGALSRNVMERAIIGSTTERMLYDTRCDVLVMKSRRQRQPADE